MADKSFEELKEELKSKLESGYILDDEKMADLEQALKDNGNDISKIDISKYSKKEQEAPESSNDQKNQGTVISDHDNSGDENTHEPSEPVDENWKEDYKREWRQWAEENNKEFEDVNIPGSGNDVQIRLFDSKEQKKKGEYAAQISYKSPHNVSLSGANGKVPDSKYFEQTVALAMKKNGPDIEFGDIKSDEFSAKLLAACYINGANPTGNVPTEEEMAQWPKELQDMVNAAKEKAEKGAETPDKTAEADKTPKTEENDKPKTPENTGDELSPAAKRIAELRAKIQSREQNLQEAKEAALAAGAELYEKDIKEISQEGMSAEEIKLRELRGQAKAGDKTAQHQLDQRRYNTMTDEYKYVREVEMEADGKTEKKDENGKPVYKKDDKGNFVYKTDEKGQKVKSDAYKAFLARAAQNMGNSK